MKKSERVNEIQRILDAYFPNPDVPLNHTDAYTLTIAVLLSAQCTDERVNLITPKLFKLGPNPSKMASLSREQIYKVIKPCGLGPQKSKAIKELSKILIRDYDGRVPEDIEELEKLPGVGHKTASVVVSQAFGKPSFPVDTHTTDAPKDGNLHPEKMSRLQKRTLKDFSQLKNGINFIFKLSCTQGNTVQRGHVTL